MVSTSTELVFLISGKISGSFYAFYTLNISHISLLNVSFSFPLILTLSAFIFIHTSLLVLPF